MLLIMFRNLIMNSKRENIYADIKHGIVHRQIFRTILKKNILKEKEERPIDSCLGYIFHEYSVYNANIKIKLL